MNKKMATPKKRGGFQQPTIMAMFTKKQQNDSKLSSPAIKLSSAHDVGGKLTDNHVQSLKFAADHHNVQASKKRQRMDKHSGKSPDEKRMRLGDDEDLLDVAPVTAMCDEGWGDESGGRWLTLLQQYLSSTTKPNPAEYQQLVTIIRMHGLHTDKSLSLQAFGLLQMVQSLFPCTSIEVNSAGGVQAPCVMSDEGAFNMLDRMYRQTADPYDCQQVNPQHAPMPFVVFCHLVSALQNMCLGIDEQPTYEIRENDVGAMFGEVLLLKCVLAQLQRDLRVRLHVLKQSERLKGEIMNGRREALLTGSMLWRLFSEELGCYTTGDNSMEMLVGLLMELIGSAGSGFARPFGRDEEEADGNWLEMSAVSPGDGAQLASLLLNMLLEMFGVAEDLGMFCRTNKVRRAMTNLRMSLDFWMHEGLSMAKRQDCFKVGYPLPPCRAFLASLHPRDCQRLICLLIASKRVHSGEATAGDKALTEAKWLYQHGTDVKRFVSVDPVHVLTYVAATHTHALHYLDITGADGLALLVTQLVQSVIHQNPSDAEVKRLRPLVKEIATKLFADNSSKKGDRHALDPASMLGLAAACQSLGE